MNLVIDIGNTNAKLAIFEDNQMVEMVHDSNTSLTQIDELARNHHIEHCILSSVVELSNNIKQQLTKQKFETLELNYNTPVPITNKYQTPHSLGMDRLAAVVGASCLQPDKNLLVIDVGTAITYDFINSKGEFLGGNISPGIRLRLQVLASQCDKLPLVKEKGEVVSLGFNTETAIRSGVICGIQYEIEGYINELTKKHGEVFVFLTGGDTFSFATNIKSTIFADSFLVLKGLNRILNYNVKK